VNAEPVTLRRRGIGLAVAVALLTAGCAAGQQAQTAYQKAVEEGTEAMVGAMALRGVLINAPSGSSPYYPAGGDATMRLVIVNDGAKADQLTGITSASFTSWGAFSSTADAATVANGANSPSLSLPPSSAAAASTTPAASSSAAAGSSSAAGASSAATSASATPTPQTPAPSTSVAIASGARVSWGVPDAKGALLLMHLKQRVYPGSTIVLTFTFANAGSITVRVPVAVSASPQSSTIPAPTSGGEG
jgi:copper(I)-binding protein